MNKYGFHARRKEVMRYFMPQQKVTRQLTTAQHNTTRNIVIDWVVLFTWAFGLGFVGAYIGGGDFGIPFCLGIVSVLVVIILNGEKQ